MKKLALLIGIIAVSINLMSQDITDEEWKQMSRPQRKEYRKRIQSENHEKTMDLLNSRAWVLEAFQVQDRYGESATVIPSLNFVGVSGDQSTVQLGSNEDVGWNGVGGITVEGTVRSFKLNEAKKQASGASVQLEVSGASSGHISVSIQVSPDGAATATVSDNYGDRLTYRGRIVALAESSVYKGQVLF